MSKTEILEELPKLQADERREIFERLCELRDEDLIRGDGPTDEEKRLLDEEIDRMDDGSDPGIPWSEVLQKLNEANA